MSSTDLNVTIIFLVPVQVENLGPKVWVFFPLTAIGFTVLGVYGWV